MIDHRPGIGVKAVITAINDGVGDLAQVVHADLVGGQVLPEVTNVNQRLLVQAEGGMQSPFRLPWSLHTRNVNRVNVVVKAIDHDGTHFTSVQCLTQGQCGSIGV